MPRTGPLVQHLVPLSPAEPPRVFGAPTLHTESELLALGMNIDGTLWSVEEPGLLRQWSLGTRKQQGERQLDELATAWAFNWAGRLLGSASDEVAVWEVASGEQLAGWKALSWVTALAFQPGHPVLATGHDDGIVQVWDWSSRARLGEFKAHNGPVSALAFAHDGKLLATSGEELAIHLWDFASGTKARSLIGHTGRIPTLAWHPDRKRLFSAGWDTTVRVWDVNTGEPIILLNSHSNEVHACALSADGRLLASADADSAVHVWDTASYQTVAVLRGASAEVRCLCWTPDDDRGNLRPPMLAYGGADRVIHLWDSRQGPDANSGADNQLLRTRVAVSPDGARLFGLGSGTDLRAWDVNSGAPGPSLEGASSLRTFALSPNGLWVAASLADGAEGGALHLYQPSGHRLAVCEGQKGPITALAFSPSSSLLASAGVRGSDVWLWTVPGGSPALLLNDALEGCSVEALAWHPDGQFLAVGGIDWMATSGQDGELAVWEPHARKCVRRVHGGVTALAYHPRGFCLAAARVNCSIRLFRDSGDLDLVGHIDTVHCLAFSADGRWLASGGEDRTVRVWDAATGQLAGAWALENAVRDVAFGPEGKYLYTGNGNTSFYQIELEQLLSGS